MQALWLYIKHNQLQDGHEREYINCNRYFRQVSWVPVPPLVSQHLPCLLPQSPTGLALGRILHTDPGMTHSLLYPEKHLWFSLQIFSCGRLRFSEIPMKLAGLLQHPDPIVINHVIR